MGFNDEKRPVTYRIHLEDPGRAKSWLRAGSGSGPPGLGSVGWAIDPLMVKLERKNITFLFAGADGKLV